MNNAKTFIALLLSLILITVCGVPALAAGSPTITLSNKTVLPGESVTIDINILNNPGIMAMAFCITYDSSVFEYTGYTRGYLSKYTVKDHPDKGHVAVVNDEASNKSKDGTVMSVSFKIKDNAAPGKYTITLANINREKYGYSVNNSFSNSSQQYVVPTVKAGSITVEETCENSGHKYGEWQIITPADCTHTGLKEHKCVRCEYPETAEIPITHDFESDWTVDKAATPDQDGIMSRHCKKCDAVTDKITFTYEEVEDGGEGDQNNSSGNNSSQITESSSEESQTSSSGTTTSNSGSSGNSSSNKTQIDNTVGAKNPLSVVENIKDYQENIKPNANESDTSSDTQSSSDNSENNTVSSSSTVQNDSETELTDGTAADGDYSKDDSTSAFNVVILVIAAILSTAIITIGVILIIKRKKTE